MTTDASTISMRPAVVHFTDLVEGDTLSFKITLTDDAGDPIDLTGTTTEMDIKRADESLVLTLTIGDGITYTDAAGGEMTIEVDAADTANFDPQYIYRYDVQWTNGTTVRTLAWGTIQTIEQVTT